MNRKQPKTTKGRQLQKAIEEAIEALDEHWVYDVAQSFQDRADATARITQLLEGIRRKPDQFIGRKDKVTKQVSELIRFLKEWDRWADRRLRAPFSCPEEVEWHLEGLTNAVNLSTGKKSKIKDRWSREDASASLEPPIWIPARRFRTDKRIKKS